MPVKRITWLPHIEDKLLDKHDVLAQEVEEVLFGMPHIRFVEKGHQPGEDLYAAYGQTDEGRYLIIFYLLKQGDEALIISGRDMDDRERRLYGQRKGK
jgi:uncharacterized protein